MRDIESCVLMIVAIAVIGLALGHFMQHKEIERLKGDVNAIIGDVP